jgi:histidyl-tRNA synthetase
MIAVIPSVNYADMLAVTLPAWKAAVPRATLRVVTSRQVVETHRVCRAAGVVAEIAYRGNLKRRMERANRINARAAVILGETEIAAGVAQLRDLDAGTQESVAIADIPARLQ